MKKQKYKNENEKRGMKIRLFLHSRFYIPAFIFPLLYSCFFILSFVFFSFISKSSFAVSSISVVEISGKKIPSFSGKEISKIDVVIFKNGEWKGIPFQIDEKAYDSLIGSRNWALDQSFSRRADLSSGDGKLDEDEVILFMSKEMGEKATSFPTATEVLEVKFQDHYAYLLLDPKSFLKNDKKQIQYNPQTDSIETSGYKARFNLQHPIIQEELVIKNQATGALNILDRFKVRALLAIRNFFDFKVEEENITSRKVGYRLGPIRLIRRLAAYKSLGPIRVSPKVESDFLFYPYHIRIPTLLNNPVDGRKVLDPKTHGFAGFDFNKNFYGTKLYAEKNPTPIVMNGNMSVEEKNLNLTDVTWWGTEGTKGSMIVKVEWDPALTAQGVTCNLYYKDDAMSVNPPEAESGELIIGFQLDYSKMPAGKYSIYLNQIFPEESFSVGEIQGIIQQAIKNPSVQITKVF